ncbi:MAG: hypothetical protein ACKVT2_17045 [Saprospiraceae bacterium]
MLTTSRFADQKASPAGVEMGFRNVANGLNVVNELKLIKVIMLQADKLAQR